MKQVICVLSIVCLCSCSPLRMLNTLSHHDAKNPKVMTEAECLQFAKENLREGIRDIYVVASEPTDSAMSQAMKYYFAYPRHAFDGNELEYDSICNDTTFFCGWESFGAFYRQESFGSSFLHSDSAKSLDHYLHKFKRISEGEISGDYPITFLLGLSPDNQKMNLSINDINELYDAWQGKCRIIVVITNPLESWGLKPGKKVIYKLNLISSEKEDDYHTMISVTQDYKFPQK